jgi:hypothetical protein
MCGGEAGGVWGGWRGSGEMEGLKESWSTQQREREGEASARQTI